MDTTCGNNGEAVGNSSESVHNIAISNVIGGIQHIDPSEGGPPPSVPTPLPRPVNYRLVSIFPALAHPLSSTRRTPATLAAIRRPCSLTAATAAQKQFHQLLEQQQLEQQQLEQQQLGHEQRFLQLLEQQQLRQQQQFRRLLKQEQQLEQQQLDHQQLEQQQQLGSIELGQQQLFTKQQLGSIELGQQQLFTKQQLGSIELGQQQLFTKQQLGSIELLPEAIPSQQFETPIAAAAERSSLPTRAQDLPPNTYGFTRRDVSSLFCFHVYYERSLQFLTQNQDVMENILKIWAQDPFHSHWDVIAQAYTLVCDVVGAEAASLPDFVEKAVTVMNLPHRSIYLHHLGWVGAESDYRGLRLSQDESMVERAKFLWEFEYSILASKMISREVPTVDLDLLNICLTRGYLEGHQVEVLYKVAIRHSTKYNLGPSLIQSLVGGEENDYEETLRSQRRARNRVSRARGGNNHRGQLKARLRRRRQVRFVNLSAEDITARRTFANAAHGLGTTRS
nr:putative mating-type 1-1-1 protein [Ceratocystis smalleyi]WRK64998.1 putative mating-type 1-1-1 protein [Ceratocystis smalleyi]